ncbi:MAG: cytochrome ubiquinol oxidase subunit I [Propionibacteriaceae bacterium]|nr:cytochrome ubiquinol oxidase subunit I [Propionibacteriaceae bacterium]
MSPDTIARWQFGITTVYHFLFVPLTIALSVLTAVLQTIWNKTGNDAYLRLTKFFGRLFLINFAMGVVTGIVQEFQFGMNWSEYSRFVGDIFGAPLALEALIAFFLESTFLGIWIFGWDRLSKKAHLTAIWLGAAGTFISSIFIVAANAWMQNPTGARFTGRRAELTNLLDVILNPVFLTQWPHTIAASFVTAGGFMAGIAFYLLIKKTKEKAPKGDLVAYRKGLKMGAWVLIIAGACTVVTGDFLGKTMVATQPMKMAAAEGLKTPADIPADGKVAFQVLPGVKMFPGFVNWLYGTETIKDMETIQAEQFSTEGYQHWDRKGGPDGKGAWKEGTDLQRTAYAGCSAAVASCGEETSTGLGDAINTFPKKGDPADLAALLYLLGTEVGPEAVDLDTLVAVATGLGYTEAEITALVSNKVEADYQTKPSAGVAFWSFRLMMGIGCIAVLLGILLLFVTRGGKVPNANPLWTIIAIAMPVLPLIANSFGWIFTEMARQPWIVNGVLPTYQALSPSYTLGTGSVWFTVVLYTAIYGLLAVVEVGLLLKYIKMGLPDDVKVSVKDEGEELSFAY